MHEHKTEGLSVYHMHRAVMASGFWHFFIIQKIFNHVYVPLSADACGGQKRTSDPLELELQVAVSHLTWVLGTKLRSSRRT